MRAVHELSRHATEVKFAAVAAIANVSRQFLYTNPELREEIDKLRGEQRTTLSRTVVEDRASDASIRTRLRAALDDRGTSGRRGAQPLHTGDNRPTCTSATARSPSRTIRPCCSDWSTRGKVGADLIGIVTMSGPGSYDPAGNVTNYAASLDSEIGALLAPDDSPPTK